MADGLNGPIVFAQVILPSAIKAHAQLHEVAKIQNLLVEEKNVLAIASLSKIAHLALAIVVMATVIFHLKILLKIAEIVPKIVENVKSVEIKFAQNKKRAAYVLLIVENALIVVMKFVKKK